MIGILIVTHGELGEGLLNTAEMIMGEQENAGVISLAYDKDLKELQEEVLLKVNEMDKGKGMIVFTDLFGGSTSNSVASALRKKGFAAVCGVNLPMLIECISLREFTDLKELTDRAIHAAKEGIKDLKKLLEGGKDE